MESQPKYGPAGEPPLPLLPMWHPMTWDYVAGARTATCTASARLEALVAERTRELRASETKFRGIFENAVEGVQSSLDGRNLAANPAMARICGYRDPEELRAAVTDVATHFYVDPGRRDEINARLARDGVGVGCESEIRRRDGNTLWVSENVRLVHDAATGRDVYPGSIVDIAEKRAYESTAAKSPRGGSSSPAAPDARELPAAEEIEALLALAQQGDVIKLRARLQEPRNQAGACAPFIHQLEGLATGFQLGRIARALQNAQATLAAQPR